MEQRLPDSPAIRLSVVIPCFNEAECIERCWTRVSAVCKQAVGPEYEIIFVNDGSRDATLPTLRRLANEDPRLVIVDLSRNFGHQSALSAGLSMVRGELIFVLDGDLQDPPELLPDMMRLLDAGADVVYGQRSKRAGESLFKKQSATIFYRVVNWLSEINIPVDAGDFRLMRRSVVNVLLDMPESHRFIRGMVAWVGFKQVPLVYEREARFAGHSKYPLRKMVLFAVDAISGFSIVPLRLAFYLAALFMIAALLLGAYVIGVWLFVGAVRGWTSLLLLFLMFSGVQLLCISIIGEYVGRTYMQTKGRPLFIIKEVYTQPEAKPADHEARVKHASLENA